MMRDRCSTGIIRFGGGAGLSESPGDADVPVTLISLIIISPFAAAVRERRAALLAKEFPAVLMVAMNTTIYYFDQQTKATAKEVCNILLSYCFAY